MQELYKIKLKSCFKTGGVYYSNDREHLVSDSVFSAIPPDILECHSSIKLPFDLRGRLGFSANSPIGAAIVDGLYVFATQTPGRHDLVNWCILNDLRGLKLANLITELYGDVSKSYFFWADMLDSVFKYSFITLEDFREQLKHRAAKRGTILAQSVDSRDN